MFLIKCTRPQYVKKGWQTMKSRDGKAATPLWETDRSNGINPPRPNTKLVRKPLQFLQVPCCSQVVVFTASLSKYADPLLDLLDPHQTIRHRLFREHCCPYEGNYVKVSGRGIPLASTEPDMCHALSQPVHL